MIDDRLSGTTDSNHATGPTEHEKTRFTGVTTIIEKPRASTKFSDPDRTLKGETRARVGLVTLRTLWINTGSLCNITCRNCYIESSPDNDRLVYPTADEIAPFIAEAAAAGATEIGFTGGEPFMNPDLPRMLEQVLSRGLTALVLTNAMAPMQRQRCKDHLTALATAHGGRLQLRVSVDHHTAALHDVERGAGTFDKTAAGIDWLVGAGISVAIAGRTCWGENESQARAGYARLFAERDWPIDAADPVRLVLFPEMEPAREVPEISTACWNILGKHPDQMMCASARMVVKRRGAAAPVVLPCTLLPYEPAFEMGATLAEAAVADGGMFEQGAVKLCHPYCAQFCVLGGGACS